MMPTLVMMPEQRDDVLMDRAAEAKGDYFFLFDNPVDYRFARAKREPRRKSLFRRFSRRSRHSKDVWRRRILAYDEDHQSPDTTALMSEDEHSMMNSCRPDDEGCNYDLYSLQDDCAHKLIWPETVSLVEDSITPPNVTAPRDSDNTRILIKKWKSRMGKSLRKALAAKRSVVESQDDGDDGDDESSLKSSISAISSIIGRARKTLRVSGRSKSTQRAKDALHKEDIGLYVSPSDDEVETVFRSTFEQLCVPTFPDYKNVGNHQEPRDGPPAFPETVGLYNGQDVARLLHEGSTTLVVNYDSDCPQLQIQSEDERSLHGTESEETEYNLFGQSSAEDDDLCPEKHGRYRSLLAQTSTESEDPSIGGLLRLCNAYPLPPPRSRPDLDLVKSTEDPTVLLQESTSIEDILQQDTSVSENFSDSSRRLGIACAHPSAGMQGRQQPPLKSISTSSEESERRLGISCAPVRLTETSLEDAADVWKRIYAPSEHDLPSPTPIRTSYSPWGCGLDASPISVHSDISDSEDGPPANPRRNPFYNIRRYTSCGGVDEEEHPFDEVDSNTCASKQSVPVVQYPSSFSCGVPEMVQSSLYHKVQESRPRCECVKCSVVNMYENLLN